jgi:hypothetical protein
LVTQPFRAGLRFGFGPPGLYDAVKSGGREPGQCLAGLLGFAKNWPVSIFWPMLKTYQRG